MANLSASPRTAQPRPPIPSTDPDWPEPVCPDHRPPQQPHCALRHRAWPDGCDRLSTATVGLLCGWHRDLLDTLVDELHEGFASLALIEVAGTSPRAASARTARTKNPSPPAPANLDVLGLRDSRTQWDSGARIGAGNLPSVPSMLREWLEQVRDGRQLTETYPAVRNGVEVHSSRPMTLPTYPIAQLGMLRRHHDWIAGQEWVPDYLAELTELRQAINSTLVDKPILRTWGACYLLVGEDPCTGRLVQDNGSDVVRCTQCRARWVTAQQLAHLEASLSSRRTA